MSEDTMTQVPSTRSTESQTNDPATATTTSSSPPKQNLSSLPPIMTSPPPARLQGLQRAPSYKQRLSTFSNRSNASAANMPLGSRPASVAFPQFHSSLPYALVRDFAYPPYHLLHYGPPPERESGISTPASEAQHRRLSDPIPSWSTPKLERASQPWSTTGEKLPTTSFGDHDGPPYSEDEDLASPVVTSSRHRKGRSNPASLEQHRGRDHYGSANGGGNQTYYLGDLNESPNGGPNDSDGDFITYAPTTAATAAHSESGLRVRSSERRRDSHFATLLPNRSYDSTSFDLASSPESPSEDDDDGDYIEVDPNRYSRDYQFTIASPDEEMHGRAVALFDFARENENELPLAEGQVILVSYRHGQGWLVAQDPKTGDTGLVPEDYVRLLRDIEGGLHGLLNGQVVSGVALPNNTDDVTTPVDSAEAKTPTQLEHHHHHSQNHHPLLAEKNGEYYHPVVSTFSTSREDFEPWPHHLLGSQASTPTLPKESYSPVREKRRSAGAGTGEERKEKELEKKEKGVVS